MIPETALDALAAAMQLTPSQDDGLRSPRVVAVLPRSDSKVVRVCVVQFKGRPKLDIRVWDQVGRRFKPTTEGVSLPLSQLKLLQAILAKVPAPEDSQ